MSVYTPYLVSQFAEDPSTTMGALTRAQWADYLARFQPIENSLMNMTTYNNPGLVAKEVTAATESANTAMGVATQNRGMNRAQYGLTARPGQQVAENRQDNLTGTAAAVEAANKTRQNLTDRNRLIAVGGIPNAGRAYGLSTEV